MTLRQTNKDYIVEQIMLSYLSQGIIPTNTQIESDLNDYLITHPDLGVPSFDYIVSQVDKGEYSSSDKIQSIATVLSQDVGISTRELYRLAIESSSFYDRWKNEIKRLSSYSRKLEQRIDSLLLLKEDTAGFFQSVGDVFSDANEIDTDLTTAAINLYETSVTIGQTTSEQNLNSTTLNLLSLTKDDISFYPLTKKQNVSYEQTVNILNLFNTNNQNWVGTISVANTSLASFSRSSGSSSVIGVTGMTAELKINFAKRDTTISKVAFDFKSAIGDSTVSCLYSNNGYTWSLVPSVNPTRALTVSNVWTFTPVTARWIKIIFNKNAQDEQTAGKNYYKFAINAFRIYGNDYSLSSNNEFYSVPLSVNKPNGDKYIFSKTSLEVCSELLDGTSIDYYVAASSDNSNWTDWSNILPLDSSAIGAKIVDFSGLVLENSESIDDFYIITPSSFSKSRNLITVYDKYKFKNTSFGVVNLEIPYTDNDDPDIIANSIVLWRNTRLRDSGPDTLSVRGSSRGWHYDGGKYSCYFEVSDPNGKIIDFGSSKAIIDKVEVNNIITIPQGIHKFETTLNNWFSVSGIFNSEEEIKEADPLYPYNHKLLIDGLEYQSGFRGEKIYTGTAMSAEYFCKKVSLFDLENNIEDYNCFAVRGTNNGKMVIIVKFNPSDADNSNELFSVKWRRNSTNTPLFKYIKLKAVLSTTDSSITPIFNSYRLKLGV